MPTIKLITKAIRKQFKLANIINFEYLNECKVRVKFSYKFVFDVLIRKYVKIAEYSLITKKTLFGREKNYALLLSLTTETGSLYMGIFRLVEKYFNKNYGRGYITLVTLNVEGNIVRVSFYGTKYQSSPNNIKVSGTATFNITNKKNFLGISRTRLMLTNLEWGK